VHIKLWPIALGFQIFKQHFQVLIKLLDALLNVTLLLENSFLEFRANLSHFVCKGFFFAFFLLLGLLGIFAFYQLIFGQKAINYINHNLLDLRCRVDPIADSNLGDSFCRIL
jgi:hypothetical protein